MSTATIAPLPAHARVVFTCRGTCGVCVLTDVVCRKADTLTERNQGQHLSPWQGEESEIPRTMEWLLVCALCTMSGRG